jgi:hypothetical protein
MSDLTIKQEKFCKKYIETGNASAAYRYAYNAKNQKPESVVVNASKLLASTKVSLRVAELQAIHQKRHEVTVDSITKELEEARQLAFAIQAPAPAVSASMGKAKLHGLVTDKADIKSAVFAVNAELSREEIIQLAKERGLPTSIFEK